MVGSIRYEVEGLALYLNMFHFSRMQYEMVVIADRGCSPLIWLSFLNFWRNNISSYYDERRYNSLIAMINIINIGCYIL